MHSGVACLKTCPLPYSAFLLIVRVRFRLIVNVSLPSVIVTVGSELVPDPLPDVAGLGPELLVPEPLPDNVSRRGLGPVALVPEPFGIE